MMKSGVSRRSSLTVVRTHTCIGAVAVVHCTFLNLSWFSVFDYIKNVKYACDRQCTEV